MAYFRPSIDADGFHAPTYDDVLTKLMDDYRSIFGADVYLGEDSKDYQMLSIFAKCLDDFTALAVDGYNARNPQYATGAALDTLAPMVGLTRAPAEQAETTLTLTGWENYKIPAGSQAIDKDGGIWTLIEDATISSGTATAKARREEAGLVKLTEGYINGVYTPIVGWVSVTNTMNGTIGKDVETDEALRARMLSSLMRRSIAIASAIEAGIREIDGVCSVKLVINDTDSTDDEKSIPSHSICALVHGGNMDKICQTIYDKKAPGIGTYGSVTRTVKDYEGKDVSISFARPTTTGVNVWIEGYVYDERIDLASLKSLIAGAICTYINSLEIGQNLVVNRLLAVAYSVMQNMNVAITSLTVGSVSGGGPQSGTMVAAWNEVFTIQGPSSVIMTGLVKSSS